LLDRHAGLLLRAGRQGRLLRHDGRGRLLRLRCRTGGRAADLRHPRGRARAASAREAQQAASCCTPSTTDATGAQVFGTALYTSVDAGVAPEAALNASLGCGVPTAVADLHEGEIVLDLGSGAGAECS
jgi:uncharacterized protein RhaS with RHS repeats